MASFCTYGGIPLVLDTMEADLFVNGTVVLRDESSESPQGQSMPDGKDGFNTARKRRFRNDGSIPLKDVRITTDNRPYLAGTYLTGLAQPFKWPSRPDLRFGEFFYPNYASRWAEAHFLITQDQYDEIMPLCFPTGDGTPTPQDFIMQQDDTNTITTSLYLLPPRPLAKYGDNPGLWLITLVDERYYWQYKNPGALILDDGTTWESLILSLAASLDITLSITVNPVYGQPQPLSDFYSNYQNAAILMDAALWNVGCVLSRNLDGTYSALRNSESDTIIRANIPKPLLILGGGDAFADALTDDDPNLTMNSVLPASVTVTFPKRIISTGDYVNAQESHIPYPRTVGDVWEEVITLADLGYSFPGVTGTTKVLETTGEAWQVSDFDITPVNEVQCHDYAMQVAADFYANQLEGLDYTLPSIIPWAPEGVNDLIFLWCRDHCYTRIQHKPWNFMIEELQPYFLAPSSYSSASSSKSYFSSSSFSESSLSSFVPSSSSSSSFSLSSLSSSSSSSSSSGPTFNLWAQFNCNATLTAQRPILPLTARFVCNSTLTAWQIIPGKASSSSSSAKSGNLWAQFNCNATLTAQRPILPLTARFVCNARLSVYKVTTPLTARFTCNAKLSVYKVTTPLTARFTSE